MPTRHRLKTLDEREGGEGGGNAGESAYNFMANHSLKNLSKGSGEECKERLAFIKFILAHAFEASQLPKMLDAI